MPRPALPIFDHHACKTAGNCVELCPTQCLDLWNDRPWLKAPQACISCGVCQWVCPTQAVLVIADEAKSTSAKG